MDQHKQPGIAFQGVDLVDVTFKIERAPTEGAIRTGMVLDVESYLSEEDTILDTFLLVDVFGSLPEDEKPPFDLRFTLHGRFSAPSGANLNLEDFAKDQAPAHLVPYMRELVANLTTRSILPTLNIGPINVIAMMEGSDKTINVTRKSKPSTTL